LIKWNIFSNFPYLNLFSIPLFLSCKINLVLGELSTWFSLKEFVFDFWTVLGVTCSAQWMVCVRFKNAIKIYIWRLWNWKLWQHDQKSQTYTQISWWGTMRNMLGSMFERFIYSFKMWILVNILLNKKKLKFDK